MSRRLEMCLAGRLNDHLRVKAGKPIDLVKSALHHPYRRLAFFAAGIILPSIFLGYLGFRSFGYENTAYKKQADERYASSADLIKNKVDEKLNALLTSVRRLAESSAVQAPNRLDLIPFLFSVAQVESLPVRAAYLIDEENRIRAPWRGAPRTAPAPPFRRQVDWGPLAEDMERLAHLEFVEKDYDKALQGYIALQSEELRPEQKAELVKDTAGIYRKIKDYPDAIRAYLSLQKNFDAIVDASGYPMGVLASRVLIDVYQDESKLPEAIDQALHLDEGLAVDRWPLEPPVAQTLRDDVSTFLSERKSGMSNAQVRRLAAIEGLRSRLTALAPAARDFMAHDWPAVLTALRERHWVETGGIVLSGKDHDAVIVAPLFSPQEERPTGFLAVVVPSKAMASTLTTLVAELARAAGLVARQDFSTDRKPVTSSVSGRHEPTVEREVDVIEPPFRFSLRDPRFRTQEQIAETRRWIFGGMIALSITVILVGLVMISRVYRREIEVADLKAEFVANVSHELRTPLAAISHIGEKLSLGRYRSSAERKEFYALLGKETSRLRNLIEEVLDFSKMMAGKSSYKKSPFDWAVLVQEALEHFEPQAAAKGFAIAFTLDADRLPVVGDARAILQAVLNVLDNAVKYSGSSRKIEVVAGRRADNAFLSVRDYGIGISDDDKARIFEKFYRGKTAVQEGLSGGVGLGLAMVKHIVKGHDGRVQVDNTMGAGSQFILEIPLAKGASLGAHFNY